MSKRDLCKLADSRHQLFSLRVPCVRSKLAFLRNELAMDDADIRRVLLKFPRIIEYKTERTVRPRLNFLLKHGVAQSDLSKVGTHVPPPPPGPGAPHIEVLRSPLRLPVQSPAVQVWPSICARSTVVIQGAALQAMIYTEPPSPPPAGRQAGSA